MSFNIVADAANDLDLQRRVTASVQSEAVANEELSGTVFAQQVRSGYSNLMAMYWAVATAVQLAYEAGVQQGRGAPGHDQDVVTDGAITSAVVANWPPDPPVMNPTMAGVAPPPPVAAPKPVPAKN